MFSWSGITFKFFGGDLVVQIGIYNAFEGDVFRESSLKHKIQKI